jgi:flavin-dependent dehydrogenase
MGATLQNNEKTGVSLELEDGNRVAVLGGGPAGAFFAYFCLRTAARIGLEISVDIYEPKQYHVPGPSGCNMCGGIVSESLVQFLATEGIILPVSVVQRGIESYVLHMDVGSTRIEPPGREKRIAAVHRGAGPRGLVHTRWASLDGYLLNLATATGAKVIPERVERVAWVDGRPQLATKGDQVTEYDLLAAAVGVNGRGLKFLEDLGVGYQAPKTTKTAICEFLLGEQTIEKYLCSSMHVFLLNLPRLEFGALIPKGEYVTMVLLGDDIDKDLVASFLNSAEVRRCFPPNWSPPSDHCRCFPSINVKGSPRPFADRVVFIGDCGESRLYKDGIGGAYRTAKAAARAAVLHGVSAEDFRRHYYPVCRALAADNKVGKFIFRLTRIVQRFRWFRLGILRMLITERGEVTIPPRLSGVLWDTFTGSTPYRDILRRTVQPGFLLRLAWSTICGFLPQPRPRADRMEGTMNLGELGKVYQTGDTIVREGEVGDCMYVIQSGKVEVVKQNGSQEVRLAELAEGDFFGEMALFDGDVRSATVRPLGEVRVLTVDKKVLLRKIHEDPSLAFRIMQRMSGRIRDLDSHVQDGTFARRTVGARA